MKKKFVKVPFDLEMAKKITSGEMAGKIVTKNDLGVRILCFEARHARPIVALIDYVDGEKPENFTKEGFNINKTSPCSSDLMLEIPASETFKEGDVVVFNEVHIGLLKSFDNGKAEFHAILWSSKEDINTIYTDVNFRYATEDEKWRFIDATKRDQTEKSCNLLKKFFGIETKISKVCDDAYFIPGMAVLGIDEKGKWRYDMFSYIDTSDSGGSIYVCLGRSYKSIIPFYGNECLAGSDAEVRNTGYKKYKRRKENNQ